MTIRNLISTRFSWILPDSTTLETAAVYNTAGTVDPRVFTVSNNSKFLVSDEAAGTASVHGIQRDIFISIQSEHARTLQERLRARWPSILERAQALRDEIPDPVQSLTNLLDSLPGDEGRWQEIIEEPYG